MTKRLRVLLDACVIVPNYLRDFLLRLAILNPESWVFEPYWSAKILDEMSEALRRKNPPLKEKNIKIIAERMNHFFPDAMVQFEKHLPVVESMNLPDPNDCHVVAAAIAAKADVILTFNLSDFPNNQLKKLSLVTMSPSSFVAAIKNREAVRDTLKSMATDYTNPCLTTDEIVLILGKAGLDLDGF